MMMSSPLKSNVDLSSLGFSSSATIVDCVLQEIDSKGQLAWQWRASDHISVAESLHPFALRMKQELVYEPFHCNSIDTDRDSGNVLLSARHTDAVYLIDRATGRIAWRMGGGTRPNRDGAQLLTVVDDPEGTFHGQHDARFEPGGYVSLYDNQSWNSSLAARGVVYHIDTANGTATMVWSYQAPDGHNSAATGNFERMNRGTDNVIAWGVKKEALFTEVDGTGRVILEVTLPNSEYAYRVVKVPLPLLDRLLLRGAVGQPIG
jgi:hypothetical protein